MLQTSESFSDAFDVLSYNIVCHTAGLVLAVSSLVLHKYVMRTALDSVLANNGTAQVSLGSSLTCAYPIADAAFLVTIVYTVNWCSGVLRGSSYTGKVGLPCL